MKVFLAGLLLLGCLHISSGKDDTTTVTPETTTTVPTCQGLTAKGCEACTASVGCKFVSTGEGGDNVCLGVDEPLPGEGDWKVFYNATECDGGGEDPYTTQPTPPDTTTEPGNNTTTTTTTTSTTTTTTTTTITTSTTTTLTTSTTTMTTTSTTPASNSTTSTTTTSTSTTTPASTVAPQPGPDTERGSFDVWSFFGGILLTLGLAAIGLVGYKYYRLRSGTAGNYNRF